MIKFSKILKEATIADFDRYVEEEIRDRIKFLRTQKWTQGDSDEELYEYAKEYVEDHYKTDHRLTEKRNYLRIGVPRGSSKVGLGDEWAQETGRILESGTSVYMLGTDGSLRYPDKRRASYAIRGNYFEYMFNEVLNDEIRKGNIFVVTGDLIPIVEEHEDFVLKTFDVGSDGEPVLIPSSIKIVKKLSLDEFRNIKIGDANVTIGSILNVNDEVNDDENLNEARIKSVTEEQLKSTIRNFFKKEKYTREAYNRYGKTEFVYPGTNTNQSFEDWQNLKIDPMIDTMGKITDRNGDISQIRLRAFPWWDVKDEDTIEKLNSILKRVGYFIEKINDSSIDIVPNYGNRFSKEEIASKFYHFSPIENKERILRKGLIPSSRENTTHHMYNRRVYLFTTYDLDYFHEMLFAQLSYDANPENVYYGKVKTVPIVVFEINTSKLNKGTKFFDDDAARDAVWTYSWIPPQALKIVYEEKELNEQKQSYVDKLKKKISVAWFEKPIPEAAKITDDIFNSVSEKVYKELYQTYVSARTAREKRDSLSFSELQRIIDNDNKKKLGLNEQRAMKFFDWVGIGYWISPKGEIVELGAEEDMTHGDYAANHILPEYEEDFGEAQVEALRMGWIAQRGNSFICYRLTRNEKDIIFMRAKEMGYERIYVSQQGNDILNNDPPEMLYESFDLTAKNKFNASNYYETDTEEVYEFAMKKDADAFELDLMMNNGIFPEREEDFAGEHSKNRVFRVVIRK